MFVIDTYLLSFRLLTRRSRLSRIQSLLLLSGDRGGSQRVASIIGFVFAQDNNPNHLTISYPSISGAQAVLWVAKETGVFGENGLDVDLVYIAGGPRSMAALLSGQLQVIGTGGNSLVAANLNGAKDAVLIATTYNTLVFSLMTRENLKDPKDLKGKSLGVTGFGSLSDFTLRTLLKRWGLDPARDVVIRPMGGYPEILASMQSGALDGGIISPPTNIRALELGFRELIDAGSMGFEYASTCYGTTRRFIRDRRQTVGAIYAFPYRGHSSLQSR